MATKKRVVDIKIYWESIIRDTEQFGQIAVAENPEFNELSDCVFRTLKDSFINEETTEYGVERWENILKISHSSTETLEERKARILTYLNMKIPYNSRVLRRLLSEALGEGNFDMVIDNDTQTLKVEVPYTLPQTTIDTITDLLSRVVPANLVVELWHDGIPAECTPLEYIECSGTQSISLGKCPTYIGAKAVLAYNIKSGNRHILSTNSEEFVFMRATQWSESHVCLLGSVNGKGSSLWLAPQREASLTKIEVSQNWMMDGSWSAGREDCGYGGVKNAFPTQLEETTANLHLFTFNGGSYYFNGKLYEMQISKGTDVYMDLVPVLDGSGVPCVYDKVSKQPFYNNGTGTFGYKLKEETVPASGVYARLVNGELDVIADTEDVGAIPMTLDLEDEVTPFVHFNNVAEAMEYYNIVEEPLAEDDFNMEIEQ